MRLVSESNLAELSNYSHDSCCTPEQQKKMAAAVKGAYKGVFYDNRFDYLCDPCYRGSSWGEMLKRRSLGDSITARPATTQTLFIHKPACGSSHRTNLS